MISSTCLRVTLPTFSLLGVLAPEAMPGGLLQTEWRPAATLVMKVKDLS